MVSSYLRLKIQESRWEQNEEIIIFQSIPVRQIGLAQKSCFFIVAFGAEILLVVYSHGVEEIGHGKSL